VNVKIFLPLAAVCAAATMSSLSAKTPLPRVNPAQIMPYEWQEFRLERRVVVLNTPSLLAAEKKLSADMKAQQAKVEAAMIKIDPKVQPILAKVAVLVKTGWAKAPAGAAAVSAKEWQQLRAARSVALETDAALALANKRLLARKQALESKVDAILLRTDPSAAMFISAPWGGN